MKLLYTFIFLVSFGSVFAQPVIGPDWIPAPGDNFVMQFANTNLLHFGLAGQGGYGLTGSNVTWDFSALVLANGYDSISYLGKADSLVLRHGGGDNALRWHGDTLMIGVAANSNCIYSGIYTQYSNNHFSGSNVLYHFPMNDTNLTSTSIMSGTNNTSSCSSSVKYLGWGKLLLPSVTYDSALLIRQFFDTTCIVVDDDQNDAAYGFPIVAHSRQTYAYQWIVSAIKNPVMTIYANQTSDANWNITNPSNMTSSRLSSDSIIYVYQQYFNSGINEINSSHLRVYPEPASDMFTISMLNEPESDYLMTLYDISGRVVMTQQFTGQEMVIKRNGMDAGSYFIQVTDKRTQNTFQKRMVFE